jgi:hypothetical protein
VYIHAEHANLKEIFFTLMQYTMKQQKLCKNGFILVEAAVGVVLFCILLLALLQGTGFIAKQVATVAHRHKALCALSTVADGITNDSMQIGYTHPSIKWYQIMAQSGDQKVTLYRAGQSL